MPTDEALRQHVLALLDGHQAHMEFEDAVKDFPLDLINTNPPNVPYTPWHLIEHIRRAQRDILDYIREPDYVELEWPKDFWPPQDAKTDAAGWQDTVDRFREDYQALRAIAADPNTDLFEPILKGYEGHTILRELLLVVDHNAYHVGELGILRQVMNAWPETREGTP